MNKSSILILGILSLLALNANGGFTSINAHRLDFLGLVCNESDSIQIQLIPTATDRNDHQLRRVTYKKGEYHVENLTGVLNCQASANNDEPTELNECLGANDSGELVKTIPQWDKIHFLIKSISNGMEQNSWLEIPKDRCQILKAKDVVPALPENS